MRDHSFKYETLHTPGELPPARGYIAPGTHVWDRNEPSRRERVILAIARAFHVGAWRA